MASIDTGAQKYARKTAPGGPGEAKYNAAKGQAVSRWVEGLAAAGVRPGPITTQAYQQGMSAAQYRGGNVEKWKRNYMEGMSR